MRTYALIIKVVNNFLAKNQIPICKLSGIIPIFTAEYWVYCSLLYN